MTQIFLLTAVFLIAATVMVPIATKFKLGSVLGYIIAGIIIGPLLSVLQVDVTTVQHFAEFGVVMMLFLVGLELEPRALWKMKAKLIGLGGLQVFITCMLVTAIAYAFGCQFQTSLVIGFIFTLGAMMGLIVGIVIVYQILYTDVADHLPEYATLKAMGYTNNYLLVLVFQQAIILACIGFLPGWAISAFFYHQTAMATGLPITMSKSLILTVYSLTVSMCFLSGAIAVNKLKSADPADIF